MSTVYITEQRALVRKEGEVLLVQIPEDRERGSAKRAVEVPLIKIDRVVVMGNVTVTAPALAMLLDERIDVCFLTEHGRFLGHLTPELSKNAPLRIAQHAAAADEQRSVGLARLFVEGKLSNMRTQLLRSNRKLNDDAVTRGTEGLRQARLSLRSAETCASVMGFEGAGSAAYFGCLDRLLRHGWVFPGRHKRPPTDPVNALLSFGYIVLTNAVASAIKIVGLDPMVGYLHQPRYGKPSLALDLVEEFRPLVVDSCVLTVLNNRMVRPGGFTYEIGGVCRMDPATKRTFLATLEERLDTAIEHPIFGYKATYRRCLELQARLLSKYLSGEIDAYPPFIVR